MSNRTKIRYVIQRRKKHVAKSPQYLEEGLKLFKFFVENQDTKEEDIDKQFFSDVARVRRYFKTLHEMESELAHLVKGREGKEVVDSRLVIKNTYGEEFSTFVFDNYSLNAYKQRQLSREGDTKPEPANAEK